MRGRLEPTKQKRFEGNIIGFDIETYGQQNKFYCCAFYDGVKYYDFYTREDALNFIKTAKNKTVFSATNLGFDFWGIFKGSDAVGINTLYQNSMLMSAKGYIKNNQWSRLSRPKARKIIFIDTLNYAMLSVEKCGKLLGVPKIKPPSFIGRKPKNQKERGEMKVYNRRDAYISREILVFFYKAFEDLGATPKLTIASTSMSLFTNKYLKQTFFKHDRSVLLDLFKGYYGGRTEAFKRGKIKDYNYYDINCFSSDTEILTENGFKKYSELKEGENVYSMNEEQNELILNPIKKIFKYDYSGEMINIYNENMNQLVTPNHRIMNSKRQRTKKPYYWEKFSYCKASDLNKTYLKFPVTRKINGNVKIDKDIIKLLAWYITEGYRLNNKTFEISQSMTVNFKKCQELKVLFNNLRKKGFIIKEKERIQKGKKYLYAFIEWEKIKNFFPPEKLNSYSMVLPNNFLKWGIEERKILYYEMIKGDGSRQKNKISYVSYSRKLLNQFSLLCLSIGFKSSINYKHKVVNIKENKNGDATNYKKQIKKYNGVVWCVSVKNLNVVVKREGKTFISGNSLYPFVMEKYKFPDPNTLRTSTANDITRIKQYEGMSFIRVFSPRMRYPYLPFRTPTKLIFMSGTFEGWYTHFEIREAVKLGYKILRVYKTYSYKKTCLPFKDYVETLYNKRKEYKKQNSSMEFVTKMFLNCFTEDTDILTKDGYKKINEIKKGELVYSYNPKTKKTEFKEVTRTFKYDYKGEMIEVSNKKYNLLVTPNHKFIVGKNYNKNLKFIEAKDLSFNVIPNIKKIKGMLSKQISVKKFVLKEDIRLIKGIEKYRPFGAKYKANGVNFRFDSKPFLLFCGLYLAEGHPVYRGVKITSNDKNNIILIENVIKKLNVRYYKSKSGIEIYHKPLQDYLIYNFGKGSKNKFIHNDIFNLDSSLLKCLYTGMMLGDGSFKKKKVKFNQTLKYTSISKKLVYDFQRLCVHLGYKSKITKEQNKPYNDIYRVFIFKCKNFTIKKSNIKKYLNPFNKVYSVEVKDNHTVFAGRNGTLIPVGQSFYGKFGQKFIDKDNVIPFNHSTEELNKFSWFEFMGDDNDFIRIKQDVEPANFCIPIWASYVTSYARHELYSYFPYTNPIYCDTDSLITKTKLNTTTDLGGMKLEMYIKEGLIVKPKFYYVTDGEENFIKIKGVQKKINVTDNGIKKKVVINKEIFMEIIKGNNVSYDKFVKLRESLRRGLSVNSIIEVIKHLKLEDNKRIWSKPFNYLELQDSESFDTADVHEIKSFIENPIKEKDLIIDRPQ